MTETLSRSDRMARHGYYLLWPQGAEGQLEYRETERALRGLGFGPFRSPEDDGRPALVVLESHAPKYRWFEAGFWAGGGAPLFVIGRGSHSLSRRRLAVLARMGCWLVDCAAARDLLEAVRRLQLAPTAWDAARLEQPGDG